jgi:cell division protein FtsW
MIILFGILIYLGFKIALSVTSRYAALLISSIVFILAIQILLNMGVVLGLLPTKGLNLPFISYGGSSLISNLLGIGLIISAVTTYRIKRIERDDFGHS